MSKKPIALLGVLVLALFGCTKPSNRAATIKPSEPPEKVASDSELQAGLLTVQDLPTGWSPKPAESPSPTPSSTSSATPECTKTLIRKAETPAYVETSFQKSEFHQLSQLLISFKSRNEAKSKFKELEARSQRCQSWTEEDAESSSKYSLAPLSFPNLGDETLAFKMKGEYKSKPGSDEDFNLELTGSADADIVVIRLGKLFIVIAHQAVSLFEPATVDSKETETISRKAVERAKAI